MSRRTPEMFDPEKMKALAEQMIAEGKMPSEEQFRAAMDRIRKEYAPQILAARKKGTEQ